MSRPGTSKERARAAEGRLQVISVKEAYTPENKFSPGAIVFRNGKILYAGSAAGASRFLRSAPDRSRTFEMDVYEHPGLIAVPGFVDIHLHGGGGADIMDGTAEAVTTALATHLGNGTTSVLATVMTAGHEDILRAIGAVREAAQAAIPIPDILGIHLEGPYLAREKSGAQPAAHIRPYSAVELREYLKAAEGSIRVVTLAPEVAGASSAIRLLKKKRILPAAGHSNATFGQAQAGIRTGIRHGTHLFNAMSGVFHRDPGLAGALLLDDAVSVEVIADGIHLHPAVLDLVLRVKPGSQVILVSDATRLAGKAGPPPRTADGRLYGSAITLSQAVRRLAAWTGRPLVEILPLATSNPARIVDADGRKGRLARGADADIVLLDLRLIVRKVFLRGKAVI
jgi:N-acetylglucosamine-6-phosphate deacetylase